MTTDPDAPRLVHYTCADAAPLIIAAGMLRPSPHPLLPEPLIWASDLRPGDVPDLAAALGLVGHTLRCDRLEHRFEIGDPQQFETWPAYARAQVRAGLLDRGVREALDATPGGLPRHWWVSTHPAAVTADVAARR